VHRVITAQLYGGDLHNRMRQEIALGIGGLRVLEELGIRPTVYHMNEGHSAFSWRRADPPPDGRSADEFRRSAGRLPHQQRFHHTHLVPAGIDLFNSGIMYEYFQDYCRDSGISFDQLLSLGRSNPGDAQESFSMAIRGLQDLRLSKRGQPPAQARIAADVAKPVAELPVWEVPITSVTNGVHLPTWINGDLAGIYDQSLQPDWREGHADASVWDRFPKFLRRNYGSAPPTQAPVNLICP